jgi:F-type H+-transporting ATPase subunit b
MINHEVIAQLITTLVAFLIFFYISKKLFWESISGAIEQRQVRIKNEFDKIETLQKQVNALQSDYQRRLSEIDAEARTRIQEEIAKGKQIAEQIAEQSRKDAATAQERATQQIAIQMDQARRELKDEVVRMTLAATERVIGERLDDAKHRQLVSSFVEELGRR